MMGLDHGIVCIDIMDVKEPFTYIHILTLNAFFRLFLGTNYENALLIDDMLYKSLFNPPSSAIFL
jgi:hypothetical protein